MFAGTYGSQAYSQCTQSIERALSRSGEILVGEAGYTGNIHPELPRAAGVAQTGEDALEICLLMHMDRKYTLSAFSR